MMLTALLLWITAAGPQGDFVLITSRKTPLTELSAVQVRQIYLGRLDRVGGMHIVPLDLRRGDPLRARFVSQYLDSETFLQDYWLRQKLIGDARPPREVGDWALVVAYVRRNPGFIGYIPAERASQLSTAEIRIIDLTP